MPATNLVRLNTNGSLDLTFPKHSSAYSTTPSQGNGSIYRLALQADGKILVGGEFAAFDGLSVSNLVRLNTNGTVDNTFLASSILKPAPYGGRVHAILPLADGKILVGGAWSNGTNAGVARLLINGEFDPTFNGPEKTAPTHAMVLINNKLIVGGQNFIKRVSYDGWRPRQRTLPSRGVSSTAVRPKSCWPNPAATSSSAAVPTA